MKKELTVFDNPRNVHRFLIFFYGCLVLLLVIDPFIHKHAEFPWEDAPGFFAAYGFVSCVLLIFVARLLRRLVKRDEDYYEKR
ncbi:MAG: hypothetical protein P8X39_00765 [Desulfofustis sp.]|jgi:hypothetical protein